MRLDCEAVNDRVKMANATARASSRITRSDWRGARAICARASTGVALRLRAARPAAKRSTIDGNDHCQHCHSHGGQGQQVQAQSDLYGVARYQVEGTLVGCR